MLNAEKRVSFRLHALAEKLAGRLVGNGNIVIDNISTIQDAGPTEICFVSSDKHARKLKTSNAAAVLVSKPLPDCPMPQVVVGDVNKALILVLGLFAPKLTAQLGIHPRAIAEPDAEIASSASVGPGAYIGHGVKIGEHVIIGANCSIGENTVIGDYSRLDANVSIYHNCKIGSRCVIQSNTTIGSTGYGYSFIEGRHQLIPHNGGVIIEDNVEIGANCCVDRAKFGNTVIGAGTKIDNLVQIAHNAIIGKHCLMAGQAAIAGSAHLGDSVIVAGQAGVSDNVSVGAGTIIGAQSGVMSDVGAGQKVWGMPAIDWNNQIKSVVLLKRLPELAKQFKELSERVANLETAKND